MASTYFGPEAPFDSKHLTSTDPLVRAWASDAAIPPGVTLGIVTAHLTGSGEFTATAVQVEARSAELTGSGAFTATVSQVLSRSAELTGSGAFAATVSWPSYSDRVLADSPTIYARLGDSSGTQATDISGASLHGTYSSTYTLGVAGLVSGGTAVSLGTSSSQVGRISFPVPACADWTIEFVLMGAEAGWSLYGSRTTYVETSPGYYDYDRVLDITFQDFIAQGGTNNTTVETFTRKEYQGYQQRSAHLRAINPLGMPYPPGTVPPGRKMHVAIVRKGDTTNGYTIGGDPSTNHANMANDMSVVALYINGVLAPTPTNYYNPDPDRFRYNDYTADDGLVETVPVSAVSTSPLVLTGQKVVLDEFAFYTSALSPTRVAVHASAVGVTADLTGTGSFAATSVPVVTASLGGAGGFTATTYVTAVTGDLTGVGEFTAVAREVPNAYLLVADPAVDQPPATISVAMANLTPLAVVTFRINAVIVGTDVADAQGDIAATSLVVDRQFGVGTHTVSGTTADHYAQATFTIAQAAAALPAAQNPDAAPVLVVDTVDRWVLQDLAPGGLGSWTMPINPSAMTSPHVRKTVGSMATTAVHGRPHVSEGARPVEWEFSGFAPDEAFQNQLIAYSELPRRFYLIDHRDRAWTVAFASLDIRARKRTRDGLGQDQDWLADYVVRVVLFSQTPGVPA